MSGNVSKHIGGSSVVTTVANSSIGAYAKKILPSGIMQQVASNSVSNVAFAGTMAAGSAITAYLSAKGRTQILRKMQHDLTGKMPSVWAIRFSKDLHPLVLAARQETKSTTSRIAGLLQAVGVVGSAGMMLLSRSNGFAFIAKSMALSMGTSAAASMLTSGDTAIKSYGELDIAFMHTGQAPAEAYAGVVGGLLRNLSYEQVQTVAHKWAVEQVTPKEMMRRIEVLRNNPAALKELSAIKPTQEQQAAPQQPAQPVLGKHTANVVMQQQAVRSPAPAMS